MIDGIVHFCGGMILLGAVLLLSRRRWAAMITIYQLQAIALTAAALAQGYAQKAGGLYLTGFITLMVNAALLPMALRQIVQILHVSKVVKPAMPVGLSMLLGVGLIGVAVLVVLPVTMTSVSPAREDIAISLSVVLLGFLVMTSGRDAPGQVIGCLSAGNGLMLAAIGMPGLPFVAALSVALLVLAGFFIAGILFRTPAHFELVNARGIEAIEGRER